MAANLAPMTSPLAGRRVLVVDDERAIAAAVVRRLEQDGAVCVAAHSGTEGAERLSADAYDLVVTDIEMPGKSGLDLIADARALREPPSVIVMAPASDGAAVVEALGRGADGYVLKPFQPEQLAHEVSLAAELRALRATAAAGAAAAAPIRSAPAIRRAPPGSRPRSPRRSAWTASACCWPPGCTTSACSLCRRRSCTPAPRWTAPCST